MIKKPNRNGKENRFKHCQPKAIIPKIRHRYFVGGLYGSVCIFFVEAQPYNVQPDVELGSKSTNLVGRIGKIRAPKMIVRNKPTFVQIKISCPSHFVLVNINTLEVGLFGLPAEMGSHGRQVNLGVPKTYYGFEHQ